MICVVFLVATNLNNLDDEDASYQYFTIEVDEELYGMSRNELHVELEKYNVFTRKYSCQVPEPLDIRAMEQGASYLLGTHDFQSFCARKKMKKSTVRMIESIQIEKQGAEILLTYRGNGFLYNMVRILTGTLIEIGKGERKPEEIPMILEAKNREAAGPTAPASGLFLEQVDY